MKSNRRTPTWRYIVLLAGLFALSLAAPAQWRKFTAQQTATLQAVVQLPERISAEYAKWKPVVLDRAALLADDLSILMTLEAPPKTPIAVPARETAPVRIQLTANASVAPVTPLLWPRPASLVKHLAQLQRVAATADWSRNVQQQLDRLSQLRLGELATANEIFQQLRQLNQQGESLTQGTADEATYQFLLEARQSLERRLSVWEPLAQAAVAPAVTPDEQLELLTQLRNSVAGLYVMTENQQSGADWRTYLQLEPLRQAIEATNNVQDPNLLEAARRSLARIDAPNLTVAQRKLMLEAKMVEFRSLLQSVGAPVVDLWQLPETIERIEDGNAATDNLVLATSVQALRHQLQPSYRALAAALEKQYRGANVRVAITASMVNRMISDERISVRPVRDNILGADVQGQSHTVTRLRVKPIPDDSHLCLDLEALGNVQANTEAESGPARFYSEGHSSFTVSKRVDLGSSGLLVADSKATANNYSDRLVRMETNFDGFPILEGVVRGIARNKHNESRPQVRGITEYKLANRARNEVDQQVAERLKSAGTSMREMVWDPLELLGLQPTAMGLQTSENRFTMRLRLAGEEQLASEQARPYAPSDSLLSIQVNETAINNFLAKLELGNHEMDLIEVYKWVAGKLGRSGHQPPDTVPAGVRLKFVAEEPIKVKLNEDRLELIVSLAFLTEGHSRWREFSVHYFYRLEADGISAKLVRDRAVQLSGETMKGKPEVVLRGIFSKALPRDKEFDLTPAKFRSDKRYEDLEVTQFQAKDGWIAVAYAPRVTARGQSLRPESSVVK